MFDDAWGVDLIAQAPDTVVAKFDFDSYNKLKETQPVSAIKINNRVMR